jgi:ELWxxDGT repeat protein
VDGTLFFTATYGTSGHELWKSDGTEAGTVPVRDIRFGIDGSYPHGLTNVGGTLFFAANDGTNGDEPWKSDGTEAGTVLLKDIRPGSYGSFPFFLTNVGGVLVFQSNDGIHGYELWKSDGTEAGTVIAADIGMPGGSDPLLFIDVAGTIFFAAQDDNNGRELWKLEDVLEFNRPPTLDAIADPAAIGEDAGEQTVNLSGISAGTAESQSLQVIAISFNTNLIPNPVVTYSSPDATGSLAYAPVADAVGSATIMVTVRDAGLDGILGNADDGVVTRTFTVTVLDKTPPTVTDIWLVEGARKTIQEIVLNFSETLDSSNTEAITS